MIDELRIKCPSCGVILEVKNSKHETVKRITCPNCKKQLAVDFQMMAEPKPLEKIYYGQLSIALQEGINQVPIPDCDYLEINVVRINNGNSKCIVRPLSGGHPVLWNGMAMEQEDKAVLAVGDTIQIGNTVLGYGKPVEQIVPNEPDTMPTPPDPQSKRHSFGWLFGGVTLISALLVALLMWPAKEKSYDDGKIGFFEETKEPEEGDNSQKSQKLDTGSVVPPSFPEKSTPSGQTSTPKVSNYSTVSDYDLELEAGKGNLDAQYEVGRRMVNKGDSVSIVLGIKYLKKAMHNGSNDAWQVLQTTYINLERKAANGNTIAENILKEQR